MSPTRPRTKQLHSILTFQLISSIYPHNRNNILQYVQIQQSDASQDVWSHKGNVLQLLCEVTTYLQK